MHMKNMIVIISGIIVMIIIGGILGQDSIFGDIDQYSVDSKTVVTLLENQEHVLVVDIRTAKQYQSSHLSGISHDNLDSITLEKRVKTIQNRLPEIASTHNIILVDQDGIQAKQAAQTMTEMGIQTFYLDGGMNNVVSENLESSNQTIITSQELMMKLDANEDLYLLDVRQPDELLESKIMGVVNIPLAEIFRPNGMDSIPKDRPVIVICGSGNRATIATYALAQEGIDFQVLEGGMKQWNSQM